MTVHLTYWPWEGVAHHKMLCNSELATHLPHLVFEELTQWLQKSQAMALGHAFRQSALGVCEPKSFYTSDNEFTYHVVVGLDSLARSLERQRLNHVWVSAGRQPFSLARLNVGSLQSPLKEPLNLASLVRVRGGLLLDLLHLSLKCVNEGASNEFPLLFRICDALQTGIERL